MVMTMAISVCVSVPVPVMRVHRVGTGIAFDWQGVKGV